MGDLLLALQGKPVETSGQRREKWISAITHIVWVSGQAGQLLFLLAQILVEKEKN